jgi:hypothetical protein
LRQDHAGAAQGSNIRKNVLGSQFTIRSGHDRNGIITVSSGNDESYARRAVRLADTIRVYTRALQASPQLFAERITTQLADEADLRTESRRGNSLIGSFASRKGAELRAYDGLSRDGDFLGRRHEIKIDAADNHHWL